MLRLFNQTPMKAQLDVARDETGRDIILLVAKASFTLDEHPRFHEKQASIIVQNEFWDEPETSSLKYPADNHLPQPGMNCILIGSAWSPQNRPTTQLQVCVEVGEMQQHLTIFGDRVWTESGPSSPAHFEAMPLTYENAFGGSHRLSQNSGPGQNTIVFHLGNPLGKGFRGKRTDKEMIGQPLPNIEAPHSLIKSLIDTPEPVGVAAISPTWEPRVKLAGTYDENWSQTRAPFLPEDFDSRFFVSGPQSLYRHDQFYHGGEAIHLKHVHPERPTIHSNVPHCAVTAMIEFAGARHVVELRNETLILEPEFNRQQIVMRGVFPCERKVLSVKSVILRLGR
ncbi:DUF2169 domain-containing protein [Hahella aquimaris]|uniref:DUF2169 family type VI secretion system accessory protein n=1 Tax=Hahella sp. HNIBRBA332 TaxID=3015983 RepID=UPI00273AA8A0|nr:DUF2169 domain-containing protein [Hahella sp. HNIBRBA332]WLQ14331.1 DUF2169 domain-containing protein [Hahella sp. HNIBRBA332]